jgi:hypothetical protein
MPAKSAFGRELSSDVLQQQCDDAFGHRRTLFPVARRPHPAVPYGFRIGGSFQPNLDTVTTASVRLVTFSALRMAVT